MYSRTILQELGHDKNSKNFWVQKILRNREPYAYLCIKLREKQITISRSGEETEFEKSTREIQGEKKRNEALASSSKYLCLFGEEKAKFANALFEFMLPVVLPYLNASSLVVTLSQKGKKKNISLIEYLSALCSDSETEVPSIIRKLNLFVCRRTQLPPSFILNKTLKADTMLTQ